MNDAEMKERIQSCFLPYHCGVKFLPTNETAKKELRFRVSNEDDSLIYEDGADLKAARHDLDHLIAWWREDARKAGFKLHDIP